MKKNVIVFAFITVFCVVIPAQSGGAGDILELSGNVSRANGTGVLSNLTITASDWYGISEKGSVENGKFKMRISAPTKLSPFNESHHWFFTPGFLSGPDGIFSPLGLSVDGGPALYNRVALFNNLKFSVTNNLEYRSFSSLNAGGDSEIVRERFYETAEPAFVHEEVHYIFVNRDVTVTGVGKTTTLTSNYNSPITLPITTANINLNLKRGWNTVCIRTIRYRTQSGSIGLRIEMSVANPDVIHWLYYTGRGV